MGNGPYSEIYKTQTMAVGITIDFMGRVWICLRTFSPRAGPDFRESYYHYMGFQAASPPAPQAFADKVSLRS